MGDETALRRDYVGVHEKRASWERSVAGTIRGKSKKTMEKEVRAVAKEIERAIDKAWAPRDYRE